MALVCQGLLSKHIWFRYACAHAVLGVDMAMSFHLNTYAECAAFYNANKRPVL